MRQTVFNFTFHGVGAAPDGISDGERDVWLSRAQFVSILDALAGRDDVCLTFDDGNRSDLTIAAPELAERGMRGAFFVCAGRLGMSRYLNGAELRELLCLGMSIGSHGMDHVNWRKLSESDLDREIVQARKCLEQAIGGAVEQAACPFGGYDRRSLQALRDAGFRRVYTSDGSAAGLDSWLQARYTLHRWDTPETIERFLSSARSARTMMRQAGQWVKQWR